SVGVAGDPGEPAERIMDIAKIHPGDEVTTARVTRALRRLRKHFQKGGRLEAQVTIAGRKYDPKLKSLDYIFRIEQGPKVEVAIEGAHVRRGLVKKYVPIYEEGAVDDDLLNEGRRNLRDYFQTKGYFDVN